VEDGDHGVEGDVVAVVDEKRRSKRVWWRWRMKERESSDVFGAVVA
jgi:hypothetical protein